MTSERDFAVCAASDQSKTTIGLKMKPIFQIGDRMKLREDCYNVQPHCVPKPLIGTVVDREALSKQPRLLILDDASNALERKIK